MQSKKKKKTNRKVHVLGRRICGTICHTNLEDLYDLEQMGTNHSWEMYKTGIYLTPKMYDRYYSKSFLYEVLIWRRWIHLQTLNIHFSFLVKYLQRTVTAQESTLNVLNAKMCTFSKISEKIYFVLHFRNHFWFLDLYSQLNYWGVFQCQLWPNASSIKYLFTGN